MAILKDLIVHGSSRFLNKIYANELEVSAFEAESAIIKKLTAKDTILGNATVIGLLDVQGQLHTNTWTNSNIATIDGCFYITPTLSSDSGNIVFSSVNVASLTGDFTAVNSLYIGDSSSGSTVQWTKDSKILLTGEVEVNGQWLPLGTLLGTLSANAATNSIGLKELKDNRHNDSSIIIDIRNAVSNTSLNYRNLKISLYQRKDGTDSKPLGIYMTAMGTNGKTFIDIYGGVNATTTAGSSGGFADPNLRIGNLSGLSAVEGTTPTGWGIYTTNGYFKGVIVSSAGKIGNFTINSALYSNNHSAWNSNVSGIYINNDGISGGAGGKWWLWNDGSAKIGAMTLSAAGVLTVPAANVSGELTAATINGSKITANTITASQIATNAITADELAANAVTSAKIKAGEVKADNIAADAITSAKIKAGEVKATNIAANAVTADKLDATTINASNKLTVGALTTTDQNNILNSNIQIGGTNLLKNSGDLTKWGKESGLTVTWDSTVNMYKVVDTSHTSSRWGIYQDLDIKPNTTYTFSIWGMKSEDTGTSSAVGTFASSLSWPGTNSSTYTTTMSRSSVTFTSGADHVKCRVYLYLSPTADNSKTGYFYRPKLEEGNKATDWSPAPEDIDVHKYITDIDSNKGITIKPADTSGNDYLQMNSSAINFYRNNVETLKIEDSAIRVGKLGSNLRNVYITNDVVQIRNNTSVLAEYGSSIKLYQPTTTTVAVEISSTGASFNGNVKATSLSTGTKTASTTGKGTYIDGNGNIYVGDGSSNNFTVTSAGAMTAKSGTIGKYTITSTCLYTGTGSTQAGIGGNQAFWAGSTDSNSAPFRVSYSGVLNATGATISGNITATSGTIGGASISEDGVLMIKDANISGKISASHIDVSSITIGSLSGADNYALKDDVPTTVAELTDSGSYLTTSAASSTYATQTNLNNEINARKAVYGTSSTDAGTATKVVTCSNFALYTGASVTVTFSKANTSSAPQLNINSTGAKSIKSYTGANLTEGEYKWVAGASITFTYDGTNWRMQDGGALQAKIDAASSASTASSQAGVATQQATSATNAKTAAESAKTAAESAKTAAQSAKTAAETASSQASSAKDTAVSAKNDAVSAKTDAETAKGQAQTAAGNASQSATNAANSATAAAEVMGGFTILWNYSAFGTSNNGRGYLCAFDPTTGTKSDANGWVKWNGTKRTITKQLINPSAIFPYNIPVYVVCRLSSATATTGTNYMVWYNSGWKSATLSSPSTINNSWTWADNTDIVLGKFVETASNAALTEYEIYNPPYTSKQITTNVVTAQSASASAASAAASAASAAQTATTYITNIDSNNGIRIQPVNYSTNKDSVQINSTAITMYRNDVDVMSLGDSLFRTGTASGKHTTVNSDGLHIWIGSESTAANEVGLFGSTVRIGPQDQNNIKINAEGITINKGSTQVASYKDSIILGDEANNNLLFLDKSSLSLRSGVENYLSGNEVFEVGECAETISKTVTSGQASYQWSELTNNTKELKEVTLNGELLEEGVDYTFNLTIGTITLTNAPTNSTAKLKVSFIPMNPEAIQKTITFTTPEEEYWLLRSFYSIPQHVVNIFSVSLNGTVLTSSQYSYDSSTHILKIPATPTESNAPAAGSIVEVVYTKSLGYYYTLGKRDLTKIGDYSIATGYNCMAAGDKSFAGGNYTYVAGQSSFGYGSGTSDADCVQVIGNCCGGIGRGITVYGEGNFGCGNYNVPSSSYIFSVGNGSSSTDRKNAFWVAKSGNTRVAGNLSVMNGIQVAGQMRSYKKDGSATVPLFWYDTKKKSNISISANNVNSGLTCDITLPNHTPMGIVGMRILNSSSSGANAQNCNLYIYMIVNNSSEDHITFSIKNFASSAAKVDVEFKILYIANEALSSTIDWL